MGQELTTEADRLFQLLKRVNSDHPRPEDVAEFRRWLAHSPEGWKAHGDLAKRAVDKMLSGPPFRGAPALVTESVRAGLEALRRDLGYEEAPAIERLCIELATVCWLNVYSVQYEYASAHAGELVLAQGEYWEKRLTAAQNRYARAVQGLARVRRLLRMAPVGTVQVNIGGQQVNVVGNVEP